MFIQLKNIAKTYKSGKVKVPALRDVNLQIETNEFIAVMGPSGSGKSTLMNILGCLDSPSNGVYYLGGKDVSNFNDRQLSEIRNKEIGFVFQSFYLLTRSSALHNVELPLIYAGIPSSRRKELSKNALNRVGLGSRMRHKTNELSGGERQRVAIARALVNQPSLILADEPTGNLDSRTGAEIMEVIQMLYNEGHTIILVTHEESVATHAGRILRLRDGMIESDDVINKG